MISIDPKDTNPVVLQGYLQGAVGPRPIAFASTIDENGNPNLSPFSFFNVFSSNPPILVFSPARRVRNNTIKHTLINCEATKEVVINIVNYEMVHQMSLSSTEYPDGVNEFLKAGFTMVQSDKVKPFRVGESPVQFECKVNKIIALGDEGGAGNLIICEVLKMHISPEVLDEKGVLDQHKIDLVSRMGGNWYSRANQGLFEIPKPLSTLGIGVDAIPEFILKENFFTGNELGMLGNVEALPSKSEIESYLASEHEKATIIQKNKSEKFTFARVELENQHTLNAWKILLSE
uniref:flavin reductase family protein n=1 Tax=Flavobacterium sp. TaxID=239 RepID=UPI00404A010B